MRKNYNTLIRDTELSPFLTTFSPSNILNPLSTYTPQDVVLAVLNKMKKGTVGEIAEYVLSKTTLFKASGKTPDQTISAIITNRLRREKGFIRCTKHGTTSVYSLRRKGKEYLAEHSVIL
jgi:hypothetical protein